MKTPTPFAGLHPDLREHVEPMKRFGHMLRHPLVYAVPYFPHEMSDEHLNSLYKFRKEQVQKALDAGDYNLYVFSHERPHRLTALMDIEYMLTPEQMYDIMFSVYTDSENIWQHYETWVALLYPLTGEDPWKSVHELPEGDFTIYRGGSRNGISWTLDYDKASWFAKRFGAMDPVWKATVNRNEVVGYTDCRNEKEVIVSPEIIADRIHLAELVEQPPK